MKEAPPDMAPPARARDARTATMSETGQWRNARTRLIEIIARKVARQIIEERHESLSVRPLQL